MPYIAARVLKDQGVTYGPFEGQTLVVPAENWHTRRALLSTGRLRFVTNEELAAMLEDRGGSLPDDTPARDLLVDAGIMTLEKLRAQDPDALKQISGIGPGTVKKIRAYLEELDARAAEEPEPDAPTDPDATTSPDPESGDAAPEPAEAPGQQPDGVDNAPASDLPDDFPARSELIAADLGTLERLKDAGTSRLVELGLSRDTIRAVKERLE